MYVCIFRREIITQTTTNENARPFDDDSYINHFLSNKIVVSIATNAKDHGHWEVLNTHLTSVEHDKLVTTMIQYVRGRLLPDALPAFLQGHSTNIYNELNVDGPWHPC